MGFIRQERESEKAVENIVKFVTFALGKEKFAVPVLRVKEIIAKYEVAPLPKTPQFVEGIISLRGDIIPVVDLRKRFDLPVQGRTDDTRLIVLEMDDFFVGIEVDMVFEVIKINADHIEPPPALVAGLEADFLEGVCEIASRLITILNLDRIFSPQEKDVLSESSAEVPAKAAPSASPSGASAVATSPAKPAVAPRTPAPRPAGPARNLKATVTDNGRITAEDRSFFVGKTYAGRELQLELADREVRVLDEGKLVKSFKRVV
ncbi:MAG: chemotaxis protein CheW [Deltaproteobacteria bacterium]|nr:chemotaxis protein CheW [Deltaproteobacteria bacterium]